MSSHPGYTLESFVDDVRHEWCGKDASPEQEAAVVAALEPAREFIEARLDDYVEDSGGWGEYRYGMLEDIKDQFGWRWKLAAQTYDPDKKDCTTCRHEELGRRDEPCETCLATEGAFAKWEVKV